MPVQIPDDTDFLSFRDQCESQDGWVARYNKGGVTVWCRDEECKTVQKLKASSLQCGSIDAHNLETSLLTLFSFSPHWLPRLKCDIFLECFAILCYISSVTLYSNCLYMKKKKRRFIFGSVNTTFIWIYSLFKNAV